jgi:O-antigen ligase
MEVVGLIIFYFFSKRAQQYDRNQKTVLVFCILFLTAFHLSVAILQWKEWIPSFNPSFKFSGLFNNPGPFAIYLAGLTAACAAIYSIEKDLRIRSITVLLFLVACLILYVAASRASWIGLAAALIFIVITRLQLQSAFRNRMISILASGAVIIGVMLIGIYLYGFKKDSADGRILIWKICANMIREAPVLGVGVEKFPGTLFRHQASYFADHPERIEHEGRLAGESSFAFNDLLQITAEQGIVGLILFAAILVTLLSTICSLAKQPDFNTQTQLHVAVVILIVLLVAGLFSYPMSLLSFQLIFYYAISIISARADLRNEANPAGDPRPNWRVPSMASLICGVALIVSSAAIYLDYRAWKVVEKSTSQKDHMEFYNSNFFYLDQDPWFRLNKVRYLYLDGKYAESIEILRASEDRFANASIYYMLGACYESIGRNDKAIEIYTFLRHALPDRVRPRYSLAMAYHKIGERDKFIAVAEELIRHRPKIRSGFTEVMKQEILDLTNQ